LGHAEITGATGSFFQLRYPERGLTKAISWRITGSLDTILLSWLFTQSVNTALAIGLTEVLTKTLLYYGHERVWSRIRLGVR
jgi:uncharacterized membrane protein